MQEKAFKLVESKLAEHFSKLGFAAKKEGNCCTLFSKEEKTYKLEYFLEQKQFKLSCAAGDADNLSNENFKELSTWLFDCATDTEKEAKSVANDFLETLGTVNKKNEPSKKAVKKDDQGANDIMFFINRFITIFPELKNEIKLEKENYATFRAINFCRQEILPRINDFFVEGAQKDRAKKLCTLLNNSYENGDLDVRAAITVVLLNGIENESAKKLLKNELSKELNAAWEAALRYKGKNVKPEKVKKKSGFFEMAQNSLGK